MVNPEIIQVLIIALSSVLFALGGTEISKKIPGQKWLRRFLLPILLGGIVYLTGMAEWRCLAFAALQIAAFHLGYGSSLPYWRKILTAVAFTLPSLFFGFTVWQALTPALFILMFFLSNLRLTANIFKWKYCEALTGTFIGITIADLIRMIY